MRISQQTGERIIIGIFVAIVIFLLLSGGGYGGRGVDYQEGQDYSDDSGNN
jgi:hypothetical protein